MSEHDGWVIENRDCSEAALAQYASVMTVTNGYLALKGRLCEYRGPGWPTTLINGVYDEIDQFGTLRLSEYQGHYLDPDWFESAGKSPAVANLPSPLLLRVFVDDTELALPLRRKPERPVLRVPPHGRRRSRSAGFNPTPIDPDALVADERPAVRNFFQQLDLRSGVYRWGFEYVDSQGRVTAIAGELFVLLPQAHRAYMRYTVTPRGHQAPLRVISGIEGRVRSNTTGERQLAVTDTGAAGDGICRLDCRTLARGCEVRVRLAHRTDASAARAVAAHESAWCEYETVGRPLELERVVVLCSSEDTRHGVAVDAEEELAAAAASGYAAALDRQRAAWAEIWQRCDVQIEGDQAARRLQQRLRFCIHHVMAAAPRHSDKLSVPCKLLSGEAYQGNTFYDTDLYMVPLYTFTFPHLARRCLNFRYLSLREGRRSAEELGLEGAKLAWQAGPYGEECLGRWYRFVVTNIHINADVAYALMQYCHATGDDDFLQERGVTLLVETARFYASRVRWDQRAGGYVLENVAGPDESRCPSDNNFYTNYLAAWHLRQAATQLERLQQTDEHAWRFVQRRLQIEPSEPTDWREIAAALVLRRDAASGVYEQCDGFFDLPPAPDDLLEDRRCWFVPLHDYRALNQPDVLMALALLPDDFAPHELRANWDYYRPLSMDFSSMSHAAHGLVAARLGLLDEVLRELEISAGMDLDPGLTGRRDTAEGLQGTALGGAWLIVTAGLLGLRVDARGVRLDPQLPPGWHELRLKLSLRGQTVEVCVQPQATMLRGLGENAPGIDLHVWGQPVTVAGGQAVTVHRDNDDRPITTD